MTALVRQWLLGVTAAALVLALAETLAPEGGAKRVCRLAGGLALLLAAVSPLTVGLDGSLIARTIDEWRSQGQGYELVLEEQSSQLYLAVIEEQTAAYIVDKAKELGIDCAAEVTYGYDEEVVPRPWEITARGSWTQEQREQLELLLEEELGVPAQRQYYEESQP